MTKRSYIAIEVNITPTSEAQMKKKYMSLKNNAFEITCYSYNKKGHYSRDYTKL